MKYIVLSFFLQLLLSYGFSQNSSNDGIEHENVEIPANIHDWYPTGIMVKKGDWISLEVSGIISVGPYAGNVNGAGNIDNPFLVIFSRYKELPHGALICKNDDEIIAAQTKYKFQGTNYLKGCLEDLDFLPDDFTGNLFISKSDQELKFLINDARYIDNSGSFNVSIKIYHNYFAAPGDVVIYWGDKDGKGIAHSGTVKSVDGCRVKGFDSFIQLLGSCIGAMSYDRNPDDNYLYNHFGYWTVYHTDDFWIPLKKAAPNSSDALTERFNIICLTTDPVCGKNCHGYTFMNNASLGIYGYAWFENGNIIYHRGDQSTAVKIILSDNGYKQVHSLSSEGNEDHYNPAYNMENFKPN